MIVFGGAGLDPDDRPVNLNDLHVLNTEAMAWSQPAVSGRIPQERRYHSSSVVGDQMYVFGGQYYDVGADLHFECDNAVCMLDLESKAWSCPEVEQANPLRRACHAAEVVGRRIFLVGGRYWDVPEDDYIFMNDIHVLDTRPTVGSTIRSDWAAFVNSELLSDLRVISGGRTFHSHRVVLAARSSYFRGMFESGMREVNQSEVTLDDISPEVFSFALDHMYTGREDVPSEHSRELFAAADFLGVDHLKLLCMEKIEADLAIDNVCATLSVAEAHSVTELRSVCVHFIVHHFKEVHRTDGFKDLSRDLLDLVHEGIAANLELQTRQSTDAAP